MRWNEIGGQKCSIARTLAIVGDRWTLLVLRDCFLGLRRFDDFARDLALSPYLLSQRLEKLVEHDILARAPYQERPRRYEYRLTEKGRDLYPVIVSLLRWGDRWEAGAGGPPVRLRHRKCGQDTQPTLACSACGEPLAARDVEAQLAPPPTPPVRRVRGER